MNKILELIKNFFKKTSAFFVFLFNVIKNFFISLFKKTKIIFFKTVNYVKALDKSLKIVFSVLLIIILFLICILIIDNYEAKEASAENKKVEIYTNFEGNLLNVYSDEIKFNPYGEMQYEEKGAKGKSLELKNSYLEASNLFELPYEFTFETWLNLKETQAENPVLFGRAGSDGDVENGPLSISLYNEYQSIKFDVTYIDKKGKYQSKSIDSGIIFSSDKLKNTWHHIALTFSKKSFNLYFDGKLVKTEELSETLKDFKEIASNKNNFFIGRGNNENLSAIIDEMKIFSYVLPEEKIIEDFSSVTPARLNNVIFTIDSTDAIVDGKPVKLDSAVIKEKEEILVPLVSAINAIGGVCTESEKDRFDISFYDKSISIWLMDTNAISLNKHVKLSFYPRKKDKTVYVPAKIFSEVFGIEVEETDNSIKIVY